MIVRQIRIATTPDEFRQFCDLVLEYESSLPADLRHSNFEREQQNIAAHYGPPNAALLALADDVPAGCVALVELDGSTAIIKKLYVKPDYRSTGLAKELMWAAIERASKRGFSRIVLDTERERLPAAYRLYLSLGFRECAPYGEVDYASPTFMELGLH